MNKNFFGETWPIIRNIYKSNQFKISFIERNVSIPKCMHLKKFPVKYKRYFIFLKSKTYGLKRGTQVLTRQPRKIIKKFMGQRGLLLLEKTPKSMLWQNIWNLSKSNLSWLYLNNNIFELYFFYIFFYVAQNHLAFFRKKQYYQKLLNYKKRKKLKSNIYKRKKASVPVIYNILRFSKWIIIIIFFVKLINAKKSLINKYKMRENYFIYFSNLKII